MGTDMPNESIMCPDGSPNWSPAFISGANERCVIRCHIVESQTWNECIH